MHEHPTGPACGHRPRARAAQPAVPRALSAPSRSPQAPLHAHAVPRPCTYFALVPRASASYRAPLAVPAREPHARPPARSARALLLAALACVPSAPCAHLLRPACRIVALQRAVSQYSPCLRPPSQSRYTIVYRNILSPTTRLLYCNTPTAH